MELGTIIVRPDDVLARHSAHITSTKSFYSLTFMSGPSKGARVRLDRDKTYFIGRSQGANIFIDDPTISRMHAALSVADNGKLILIDAKSANGTFVNGEKIHPDRAYEVPDGAKVIVGEHTVFRVGLTDLMDDQMQSQLYEASVKDFLTGCFTRRYLMENLEREFALSVRHRSNLALLILDIDHFKSINDTHGHLAGDYVLARVAEIIQRTLRCEDLLARYGGEEFVVVARNLPPAGLKMLAERLRLLIAAEPFDFQGTKIAVTASIGASSTSARSYGDVAALCQDADDMLYRAKRNGRNKCCLVPEG